MRDAKLTELSFFFVVTMLIEVGWEISRFGNFAVEEGLDNFRISL